MKSEESDKELQNHSQDSKWKRILQYQKKGRPKGSTNKPKPAEINLVGAAVNITEAPANRRPVPEGGYPVPEAGKRPNEDNQEPETIKIRRKKSH